jgi:hypothetical protein
LVSLLFGKLKKAKSSYEAWKLCGWPPQTHLL